MNQKLEKIRGKFAKGAPVIGTHVFLRDLCISEMIGNLDYDFVWIDGEHTGIDRASFLQHIIAMNGTHAACFVRVPWNDAVLVKPVLDMGVDGVIFPYIRSAEDARRAVASCEYPPAGVRGFGPLRANKYGLIGAGDYVKAATKDIFKIIQIEHIDAIYSIEEILAVPGIDMIVCGPNDLSGSMGLLLETRHPRVMQAMDAMAEACKRHSIPFGVSMGPAADNMRDWLRRGASFLSLGSDAGYIMDGAIATYNAAAGLFAEFGRQVEGSGENESNRTGY